MDDRTLLERAARAAGIVGHHGCEYECCFTLEDPAPGKRDVWNPLTDDGDALSLAVKLRMTIHRHDPCAVCAGWGVGTAGAPTIDGKGPWFWKEWLRDQSDDNEATRRAIVRAAASLDESKEGSAA